MTPRAIFLGAGAMLVAIAGGAIWLASRPGGDPSPRAARSSPGIRGSVMTVAGRPLAGARVELFSIDEAHAFTPLGQAVAQPDGSYAMALALPPGDAGVVLLRASAAGCATESRAIEASAAPQDFRLSEQVASVRVLVEDPAGKPHPGADVLLTFEPIAAASDALYAWRLPSDASGAVTFEGLPIIAGALHVFAEHDHARVFVEHPKAAGAIRTDVTVQLASGRAVLGRLRSPGATSGFAGAEVVVHEADGPWCARIPTGADGRFQIAGAPIDVPLIAEVTGDWILAGDAAARPWRAPRGEAPYELTLDVVPGGSIDGVVVDTTGTPLGGASVTVAAPETFAGGARRVVTDDRGRFAVKGLSSTASWSVEARYPGRAPARRAPVAARTRDLELRVAAGGALVGRVVDRGGRGVPDIEVYAHAMSRRGDLATGLAEYLAARTDADGRYRLGQLNPGRYRFEVRPTARMQWSATASTVSELDVGDGDTQVPDATVLRGASLRGRGAPADAALELAFLPSAKAGIPHRVRVQPTADGAFAVDALEEGTFQLTARSATRGYSAVAEISLVEGKTAEVALAFPGSATLDGRIQLAGGGAPSNARIDLYRGSRYERAPDDWTGNWAAAAEDGTFSVGGLSPGRWTIKITSDGTAPLTRTIDIAGGATHEAFTLDAGATLDVALASAKGAPADKVVMLEARDRLGVRAQAVTDAHGVAHFERLPRGSYEARAVVAGTPSAAVDIRDRSARRIELRVP